ncbi:MAG: radical SAM protein [Chloroflexi bacterium]|nr:radical SAM protein [Chloroflexota bacterium]MBI3341030.1 radical SAM protein [Chloroflexota bacterium]
MNIFKNFTKVRTLPTGVYQKQSPPDQPPYRIHLRLQADGSGVLIVNAATVLHLNPTAAEYAYHFIKGTSPAEAAKEIAARYRVRREAALHDFQDFSQRIQTLVTTPDLDPVSFLDFERVAPHSADLGAPLRLDCALTYRLPANTQANYAPVKRADRELTADEWMTILDKAWQAGIPHITFTGGEATLRDDLPQLIARAEKNGQVCGLLTDGLKLADKKYLDLLLQTGLDHILFILQPENPASWKALEIIMPEDIFVTVHVTLAEKIINTASEILEKLAKLGVKSLSLGAQDTSLKDVFKEAQNKAANLGLTLKFDLPVPYSSTHPVALETAEDNIPSGAGKAWLYVEPDGDVLPAQGMSDKVLGNLLRDPWEKIIQ